MRCVEYIKPLDLAWHRMKGILFTPFDLGKWFTLGFTAWLSTLFERGGSLNIPSDRARGGTVEDFMTIKPFLLEHLFLIISGTILVVVLGTAMVILVLWIKSRGKFMFLNNVVLNQADIVQPWKAYKLEGNSLLLWQIGFGIICFFLAIPIIGLTALSVLPSIRNQTLEGVVVGGLAISLVLFSLLIIATFYALLLLNHFVVPIMYKHRLTASAAWSRFMALLKPHFLTFVLYGLFIFVLNVGLLVALLALIFLTCCCFGILLLIPYLNAVLLLPVTVFFRSYSLEFLRQFGENFDVFSIPPPVPCDSAE